MDDFNEKVAAFMAAPKRLSTSLRWKLDPRKDYARASARVIILGDKVPSARIELTINVHRLPRKYGFSLIFKGKRVAGLDVDPARCHTNLMTLEQVHGTHWQFWPDNNATPDKRLQTHQIWLDNFLQRCNIECGRKYRIPPFDREQLRLKI